MHKKIVKFRYLRDGQTSAEVNFNQNIKVGMINFFININLRRFIIVCMLSSSFYSSFVQDFLKFLNWTAT